jgi:ABC-type branched-subunit amino acid transport system ATPase component
VCEVAGACSAAWLERRPCWLRRHVEHLMRGVVEPSDRIAVSLDVDAGEIVSVIGPDGAGKTTLNNAIAGLVRHRRGELRFDDCDMTCVRSHDYCSHGIALVPEGRRLFVQMSVEENLELGCYLPAARSHREESLERVYALFSVLRDKRRQPAGEIVRWPAADAGDWPRADGTAAHRAVR